MKRKAAEVLLPERPAPHNPGATQLAQLMQFPLPDKNEEQDASTGDDLASQDDANSLRSADARSTPVTTVISTAGSRKFPSDLKTIPCTWPSCTKTFNRPARLTAHLRSHNNDRPFQCAECGKTYMEEKHLRQHVKGSHTQERRYACEACGKAFLTATRLRRHAAVHEGQDRFRCRGYDAACTRTFRKHQTLQRHIRVDHLGQPAHVCTRADAASGAACDARFDSAGALRRHAARAHGAPKFWCDECASTESSESLGFPTQALLEAHMRHAHVACPFCDVRCGGGPAELHRHIDRHHSGKTLAERKTIACPHAGCGKTFTRRPNLNVHIRAAHEGLRFVCGDAEALGLAAMDDDSGGGGKVVRRDLVGWNAPAHGCGRGFVSKMKLEEHVLYVHLRRERPSAVPADGADGVDGSDLLDGLSGANRTLACPHAGCAARFVRHHDLRQHQQLEHAGIVSDALLPLAEEEDSTGDDNDDLVIDTMHDRNADDMDAFWTEPVDGLADADLFGPGMEDVARFGMPDDMQWQVDEAEMRRLIGDDNDGRDSGMDLLDPNLFA